MEIKSSPVYLSQIKNSLKANTNDKKTDNEKDKPYDMTKIMEIHEKGFHNIPSKEESDYYHNARKNDPNLDRYLYEKDKSKILGEVADIQSILLKALTGAKMTAKEEKMIKDDPDLKLEIEMRKTKANFINIKI